MNKAEMIDRIADDAKLSKADAERALNSMINTVIEGVKAGEEVMLIGFGTFKASQRAARTGRNPRTGEAIQIAASTVPVFKAGKGFKDKLKG
ncbi:MAG: DNA-binding protein HU [Legionellaceae bacterium]|nr:DNA-binding protein HU [Legionellaceae bacterium]